MTACATDVGTVPMAHESPPDPLDVMARIVADSYVGGSGVDVVDDISNFGSRVVVGGTSSTDYPSTDGSTLDPTTSAECTACPFDATITRFAPNLAVEWSRVIGGPGYDRATSVVSDVSGSFFVAGSTGGSLATTAGAGDRTFAGGSTAERGDEDGFVCRIAVASGATAWCSYVGGTGPGGVTAVALRGDVYVAFTVAAGEELHLDPDYAGAFAAGLRATPLGGADIVVLQLAAADGAFVAATYAGGSGDEHGPASLLADGGYIHLLAGTASTDVLTPGGYQTTAPAGTNLFFTSYAPGLSAMLYGTYVGGTGDDETDGNALAGMDSDGARVTVGITTTSRALPVRGGGGSLVSPSNLPGCGTTDIWLGTIVPTSTGDASLTYAGYLGGAEGERLGGLSGVPSSFDLVAVTGATSSTQFPGLRGARTTWLGPTCITEAGASEAFAALVNTRGSQRGVTFLGGSAHDRGRAIDFPVVVVETVSSDADTVPGGDTTLGGTADGFVVELGPPIPAGGGEAPMDAILNDDIGVPEPDAPDPTGEAPDGCCGTAPAPVAPGGAALAGLVMLLVRRRRGR